MYSGVSSPGYAQFYTQVFNLAVANLCIPRTDRLSEDDPDALHTPLQADPKMPVPLTTLSQTLITVFKEAFRHRCRNRKKERTALQSLDATGILLENGSLVKAGLKQV